MERTTIMLPDDLKRQAHKMASIQGISLGQFIRESITNALKGKKIQEHTNDPLFSDNAVYKEKTPIDLSENHDKYLYG